MKKLDFSISIDAQKEKVWNILWSAETYGKWTDVFCSGSHAITDWKQGSEVLFLNPDKNGIYATIQKLIPNQEMCFLHLGEVALGEKQPPSYDENAIEQYVLEETDGKTTLTASMYVPEEYIDYFYGVFPKALKIIKELSEG